MEVIEEPEEKLEDSIGEGAFHSNLSKLYAVPLGKVECRLLGHP
jgi:hypothetical protein